MSDRSEPRAEGLLALLSGRVVRLDIPVPFSPIEALGLISMLPEGIARLNAAAMQAGGRIALPDGTVLAVPRDS